MMNLKFFLLVILFILFSSCSNPSNSTSDDSLILGKAVTIHFQDTLKNNEGLIWIAFDSINDSRCPINDWCLWSGNARLSFTFAKDSLKTSFSLNTYRQDLRDTTLFGYSISLIDVMPYPHSDSLYVQDDYSATIIVLNLF